MDMKLKDEKIGELILEIAGIKEESIKMEEQMKEKKEKEVKQKEDELERMFNEILGVKT